MLPFTSDRTLRKNRANFPEWRLVSINHDKLQQEEAEAEKGKTQDNGHKVEIVKMVKQFLKDCDLPVGANSPRLTADHILVLIADVMRFIKIDAQQSIRSRVKNIETENYKTKHLMPTLLELEEMGIKLGKALDTLQHGGIASHVEMRE